MNLRGMVPEMEPVVVLLSGGQDSTTSLFWALKHFRGDGFKVEAISFDYGQRHSNEVDAAQRIADMAGVILKTVRLGSTFGFHRSAILDDSAPLTNGDETSLPSSFLPGRNLLFLTLAAGSVYHLGHGTNHLVIGASQVDYSGYPDCRQEFISSASGTLSLALGREVLVHAPLLHLSKAEEIVLARSLPGCWDALAHTVTCYRGLVPGCGLCPACRLRASGFEMAGEEDPAKG